MVDNGNDMTTHKTKMNNKRKREDTTTEDKCHKQLKITDMLHSGEISPTADQRNIDTAELTPISENDLASKPIDDTNMPRPFTICNTNDVPMIFYIQRKRSRKPRNNTRRNRRRKNNELKLPDAGQD